MEHGQSSLFPNYMDVQPILIEPISSPPESSVQCESSSTEVTESRSNEIQPDLPSPGSLYQMVNVNVNGVVKNLMIPFQEAVSNGVLSQNRVGAEGSLLVGTTVSQHSTVDTSAISATSVSNMMTQSCTTVTTPQICFQKACSQQVSSQQSLAPQQNLSSTSTTPVSLSNPSLQNALEKPLQKICLSNAVKQQITQQTSGGKKFSLQLGNKKTLVFRNEKGMLVGQLFEQTPRPALTRLVTVDKSGVTRKIIQLSPPNSAVRNIRPINIVPSSTFAEPLQSMVNTTQSNAKRLMPPDSVRGSLSPKPPKIVILSHPPTATAPANSFVTFPLPPTVTNIGPGASTITTSAPSMSSEKLFTIDSIKSLKEDNFVPVEPTSHEQAIQCSVLSSRETLKSLLRVKNDPDVLKYSEPSDFLNNLKSENDQVGLFGGIPKVKSHKKSGSQGTVSKRKKKKKLKNKFEEIDWEPSIPELDLIRWNEKEEEPVIRKIHDACVRPNYGLLNHDATKIISPKRPKRHSSSIESFNSCKSGCVGCKDQVKRIRKKKHRDIFVKLRAEHPELKRCSVVITRLSDKCFKVPNERAAVAKKSTTKSGLSLKQSLPKHVSDENHWIAPYSESANLHSTGSQLPESKHTKESFAESVTMNSTVSQDEKGLLQEDNLSKSKYLMIKTNAGTFLVPTDSSQPPMVLNGDVLNTINVDGSKDSGLNLNMPDLNNESLPTLAVSKGKKCQVFQSVISGENHSDDSFSENGYFFHERLKEDNNYKEKDSIEEAPVKFSAEKPAERIQKLKERLKLQHQEMDNARKLLETSRNVLKGFDD